MLIDRLPPITKDRFWDPPIKVVLAGLLISLLAPIEINAGGQIPVTLQTLIILVTAMVLGAWQGFFATLLYLILGAAGLPVFAEGTAGIEKFWGNTGGFLLAFPLAAFVAGLMASGSWGRRWINIFLTLITGHVLIMVPGFIWWGFFEGFEGITSIIYNLLPGLYVKVFLGGIFIILINALMIRIIHNGTTAPNNPET